MHTPARLQARARSPLSARLLFALVGAAAALALLAGTPAQATNDLCVEGDCLHSSRLNDRGAADQAMRLLAEIAGEDRMRRGHLSDQEYFSFSGIGALVCTVNGRQRTANAFLVGAFDIGVTVAHTFVDDGVWAQPQDCVYTTTDSLGQIRERIPVAYIKAQWEAEAGAFGQIAKDFAVVRLAEPSRFARRTMPLGKFSGNAATVMMIGFKSDMDTNTVKLKTKGHVYDREASVLGIVDAAGFAHDMDSRGIAAGAPVIDERSGIIIGIHTRARDATGRPRNTMIAMNDWLEATLKSEIAVESAAKIN